MRESRIVSILLPLGTLAVLVLFWEYSTRWFDVAAYLLPPPGAVLIALREGLIGGTLWSDIAATGTAFITGYIAGCSVALLAAAVVSEFRPVERAIYPVIVALQSIPKVALAPLIIVWFGFELQSKIIMVALICFFPTFVSAVIGLKAHDPNLVDLYKAFGASRRQIFFDVKMPWALTSIFGGLEVSVVLALLGTVVAEFVASRRGLGHRIEASTVDFNVATMFACVVILAMMGVIASQGIRLLRRRIAFWETRKSTSVSTTT